MSRKYEASFVCGIVLGVVACSSDEPSTAADAGADAEAGARDAGRYPPICGGLITFALTGSAPLCTVLCHDLVSIEKDGVPLLLSAGPCATQCRGCSAPNAKGCNGGCGLEMTEPASTTRTWNGWMAVKSTCGSATECFGLECAAPGRYTARVCHVYKQDAEDAGVSCSSAPKTCTTVDFDWPATKTIPITLPP